MNAIIHAARSDMIDSTLFLVGIDANDGSVVEDARPCRICTRLIINAGIKTVKVLDREDTVKIYEVADFISNEEIDLYMIQATGNILDLIGNTPLLQLCSIAGGRVFAKAEFLNPGGSIKDRVARWIIEQAERDGILGPGSVIIEATSGNTGIGVALVGRIKGYPVIIVMPEDMSEERKKIIAALGARLVLTPKEKSIAGAVEEVDRIMATTPGAFRVGQFENPRNPEVHYRETAPEIWKAMDGRIDAFVAGVGSGGTLGGVGKFLKERNPDVHIVAVEPANSAALLGH
jgi:cysteine synthase A